jgi:NADH:ubiquinone oxidoreductase subunit 4 (subunit M)
MKKISLFLILILALLIPFVKVYAMCPVCTVAVGAGVGLARWLGIDDTITGLWIGGLIVSLIMWTINYLDKRKINFFARNIIVALAYYALTVVPLYFIKTIWHPQNTIGGINKLLLGIIVGSILFYLGAIWYMYLKKKNNGHAYFPFQKVVMPVVPLLIMSVVFYFLTKK